MASKKKITISWSGGKDSAFALYKTKISGDFEIVSLHTVIDKDTRRVGLHGVREELIEHQATQLGIPLKKLYLPASQDHDAYAALMKSFYKRCADEGIEYVMFGDIYLEDLRRFREEMVSSAGLQCYFPLWRIDTNILLGDFIATGFDTLVCSADVVLFSSGQLGVTLDHVFQENLPANVDPCGERGEFHTFVVAGPLFKSPIRIVKGECVKKSYTFTVCNDQGDLEQRESSFWFQDLLPEKIS